MGNLDGFPATIRGCVFENSGARLPFRRSPSPFQPPFLRCRRLRGPALLRRKSRALLGGPVELYVRIANSTRTHTLPGVLAGFFQSLGFAGPSRSPFSPLTLPCWPRSADSVPWCFATTPAFRNLWFHHVDRIGKKLCSSVGCRRSDDPPAETPAACPTCSGGREGAGHAPPANPLPILWTSIATGKRGQRDPRFSRAHARRRTTSGPLHPRASARRSGTSSRRRASGATRRGLVRESPGRTIGACAFRTSSASPRRRRPSTLAARAELAPASAGDAMANCALTPTRTPSTSSSSSSAPARSQHVQTRRGRILPPGEAAGRVPEHPRGRHRAHGDHPWDFCTVYYEAIEDRPRLHGVTRRRCGTCPMTCSSSSVT